MEYKSKYTEAEVKELTQWFKERTEYPNEIDLGEGIVFKDIKNNIGQFIYVAEHNYANTNFSGQIYILERLKEKLIEKENLE